MGKKNKNRNVDYGIPALIPEGYMGFKEFISKEKQDEGPLISRPYVYIPLTIGLSCVDAFVLYSLTNIAMQQSAVMGYLMAFAVALVLNVLPLVIAHYIHHIVYKTRRFAWLALVGCVITFIVLFITTVNLRYEYRELYGEGSIEKIVNQVEADTGSSEVKDLNEPEDSKALAVFWLLALEPLATSIMNLILGLIGDNHMRKMIYLLEMRKVELLEEKSDIEAAEADMQMDIERMLAIDKEKSEVMKTEIKALCLTLKSVARQILAEELGDPTSISLLSSEMANKEDEEEDKQDAVDIHIPQKEIIRSTPYQVYPEGLRVLG